MGIPGIYKEIGSGTRISLAKLAIEHLENTTEHFRLAIDISIWQFQIQSGQGGRNPALRTLYYRLLRLLGLGIRPLFVFDGPYKPKFKRNAKGVFHAAHLDNFLTKELLNRFGFPYHDAPGEAEAECALLQREGVVDAVLSEDVDTMMFGCSLSLRCWTSEGGRSGKTPTHVTMYTAESTQKNAGLDCRGMILVALMSGGDYDTEGLANCGPKIACEAARAGFGREMYQLAKDDYEGWRAWREKLRHELRTNDSKFFKQKHKTISIPETFPNQKVLNYYKQPAISSSERVACLRKSIKWETEINVPAMRAFVAEAFNWTYLIGAKHFLKTFAPVLLAHKLLAVNATDDLVDDDLEAKASAEAQHIIAIHGRRLHWNTDGCPELRLSYVPANIVGLDLRVEEDNDRAEDAIEDLDADGVESDREGKARSTSPTKRTDRSAYDPNLPEKMWMLETIVKLGVPLLVETWEEDLRNPRRFATRKAREKAAVSRAGMGTPNGAIDKYVKITKQYHERKEDYGVASKKCWSTTSSTTLIAPRSASTTTSEAVEALIQNVGPIGRQRSKKSTSVEKTKKCSTTVETGAGETTTTPPNTKAVNPWTLAKRPSNTYCHKSATRYSALGIYAPRDPESREPRFERPNNPHQECNAGKSLDLLPVSAAETLHRKHSRAVSITPSPNRDLHARPLNNAIPRALRHRDATKPSPRKKQNPSENESLASSVMRSKVPLLTHEQKDFPHILGTLPSIQRPTEVISLLNANVQKETQEPLKTMANKKSAFTRSITPARGASPVFDNSSLPSASVLFSSSIRSVADNSPAIEALSIYEPGKPATQSRNCENRRAVVVRESLEGTWKQLEPWEFVARKDVFASVEVLDMTGSEGSSMS